MSAAAPERPGRGPAWAPARRRPQVWGRLQQALTITVIGAAAITGLQLGLNAPAISPVQPVPLSGSAAPDSSSVLAAPDEQALPEPARGRAARGRGRGGR
ncbi:hypothetical protein QFZ65_000902 [Arthrobacter sp. B3I9]|uniref:hypothetical protein n=1 Tax=Arthrobacter sp. B3I9 TaxID=3042270 RepID=UPI0027908561|nr:hypothetical protein [Arthrobacter sp. B3I9]MDQ0848964.1 hypothetical protein [Arthrobacter sp. B3I9]